MGLTSPPDAKPPRRRLRWLILAGLFVVGSLLASLAFTEIVLRSVVPNP